MKAASEAQSGLGRPFGGAAEAHRWTQECAGSPFTDVGAFWRHELGCCELLDGKKVNHGKSNMI